MSKLLTLTLSVAMAAMVTVSAHSADDSEKKFEAVCPVSGKPAVMEHSVKYKKAKVYFCCPNCPKAFKADKKKFATKANHQLVVTEQYVEKACPLTGKPLNEETEIDVQGADVAFCCNNCKGKVAAAEGEEQLELVFNNKAFKQGFELSDE